jgi:ferritin-like protein
MQHKVHLIPAHGADLASKWRSVVRRRSFLQGIGIAGAMLPGVPLLADDNDNNNNRRLPKGDVAILRFLAAAELVESDFWQQYNELGGVNGGNAAYKLALQNLDSDMPQYISDNTDDEMSHAAFLNAYLLSKGEQPVNLDAFRTLPSSQATGAKQIGRLTNLMKLTVDTSWNIVNEPSIPLNDTDTPPTQSQPVPPATPQQARMQAIANTAGFHFATFDVAGSSVYTNLSLNVTDPEVLRIVVSILGVEVNHFAIWHDKAGNAVSQPLAGVKDPKTGVTFPDLNALGSELFQTNLIMPEPCAFINQNLPASSVIRPSSKQNAGAVATATAIAKSQLFLGQPQAFFQAVMELAMAADAAQRKHCEDD